MSESVCTPFSDFPCCFALSLGRTVVGDRLLLGRGGGGGENSVLHEETLLTSDEERGTTHQRALVNLANARVCTQGTAGPGGGVKGTPRYREPGYVALAVAGEAGTQVREVSTGLGGEREGNMVSLFSGTVFLGTGANVWGAVGTVRG